MTTQATVSYTVDFARSPRARTALEGPGRVLRVARLLALAHQLESKIRSGEYADLADAARKLGLTRARVTQIVNLLLLAPTIQEAILTWPVVTTGRDPVSERTLRPLAMEPWWNRQIESWATKRTSIDAGGCGLLAYQATPIDALKEGPPGAPVELELRRDHASHGAKARLDALDVVSPCLAGPK